MKARIVCMLLSAMIAGTAGVTKNGSILASGLTAGTWKGDMTFDISLANAQ